MLAYGRWPTGAADSHEWRDIAEDAANAMPSAEAYALVWRALELEIATSRCDHKLLDVVEWRIAELRTRLGPSSEYDAPLDSLLVRVRQLDAAPFTQCAVGLRGG